MARFQNPDGSAFNQSTGGPVTVVAPGAGSTVTMAATDRDLYVANSGTYATLTVLLPGGVRHGEVVRLGFKSAVTTLTVEDHFGNAITGAPTAGAANAAIEMRYIYTQANQIGWVYWK